MKAIRFVLLKIVELNAIVFIPYWFGRWVEFWPEWLQVAIFYDMTNVDYWRAGLDQILALFVFVPLLLFLLAIAIMTLVYWNLKWAGYHPVWFWTEDKRDGRTNEAPKENL